MQYVTAIDMCIFYGEKHKDLISKDITIFGNSLSSQKQENYSDKLNWIIWIFGTEQPFRKQEDV